MNRFSRRSSQKEIMDDLECSGEVLEQTLRELKTINRWLGGNYVTTNGLDQMVRDFPQSSYSICDVGCGGGDMLRIMHDWARIRKLDVKLTGVDANPNTIELAKVRLIDLDGIDWEVQNVFSDTFQQSLTDILTCTLFTHHFTDEELIRLFGSFREKAKLGIIINDLHRHPLAYYSIRLLTRLFSKSPMVQHDGPLSVLRAFSRQDWERILAKAGIKSYRISWHWAFRWQLIVTF
jgi:2-polyprenyl-3-methyl-5-hydroxy-6-metoxy-1,4-benzoquinol methylase